MNAIILSIGDELTLGQTVDTNSAWLSQQLAAVGCDIRAHMTVPDDQPAIEHAIRDSARQCDFLIISGGIGPTADDLTRQALAAVMNVPLEMNESWLAKLHEFFKARGREMPETNKIQAMIPAGATMIDNSAGTAAGIQAVIGARGKGQGASENLDESKSSTRPSPLPPRPCSVYVMPGVPKEMKAMFTRDVLPNIQQAGGGAVILSRTLHTFGLGESWVAEKLGDLMKRDRNPSVGTTVSHGIVSLRINARFPSRDQAQHQLDETTRACEAALGDIIFGADGDTLPTVLAYLIKSSSSAFRIQHSAFPTITTAESCTGGLLATMLTDISGSSDYFKTGFVTYSNEAKIDLLGVNPTTLQQHGAVSEPVACEMATGALNRTNADFALSITGIAGPTGGTPEKPVGTVCIALAARASGATHGTQHSHMPIVRTFHFPGDREGIRDRSAKMALTILRYSLLKLPLPF